MREGYIVQSFLIFIVEVLNYFLILQRQSIATETRGRNWWKRDYL